jgi:hypothetical protein
MFRTDTLRYVISVGIEFVSRATNVSNKQFLFLEQESPPNWFDVETIEKWRKMG